MTDVHITPDPSDEEAAAIVAAVHLATAQPATAPSAGPMPRWRWSGRWWTRPIPQRRVRPW